MSLNFLKLQLAINVRHFLDMLQTQYISTVHTTYYLCTITVMIGTYWTLCSTYRIIWWTLDFLVSMTLRLIQKVSLQPSCHQALDSSVGRAGDCRGIVQTSLGHWFESGSRDIFIYMNSESKSFFVPFIQKWVNYQQYGPIFLFLVK